MRALLPTAILLLGVSATPEEEEARILSDAGIRGEFVVSPGCGDGALTAACRAGEGFLAPRGVAYRMKGKEKEEEVKPKKSSPGGRGRPRRRRSHPAPRNGFDRPIAST